MSFFSKATSWIRLRKELAGLPADGNVGCWSRHKRYTIYQGWNDVRKGLKNTGKDLPVFGYVDRIFTRTDKITLKIQ